MPRLSLPGISTRNPAPLDQHRRLALVRRAVTDEQIPAMDRVAAMLLLLYAQPITRIVRLILDDISDHDGQVQLRLGDPPPRYPSHSPRSCSTTPRPGRTPRPPPTPTPAGCSPDAAQTSRSTPAPSRNDSATSASHQVEPAHRRSANLSCKPQPPSSPACSATTTRASPASPPKPPAPGALRLRRPHTVNDYALYPRNTRQAVTRLHQFRAPSTVDLSEPRVF